MKLEAYFDRIGYTGSREPTLETLTALHRLHLLAIPYENLDIHLGRPLTLELPQIFDKLVTERRGGWCFEMNSLFAWVLRELGFEVTLLGAVVERVNAPPTPQPDHLILRVDLVKPYLADVGFGDGIVEPLLLEPGTYVQQGLEFGLSREGESWLFRNQPQGGAPGFRFTLEPHELSGFAGMCHALQTSPMSGFVRATVCQRLMETGVVSLRAATLREFSAEGSSDNVRERVLEDAADFDAVLRERFGLTIPEAHALWPRVWAAHEAWRAVQAAS